MFGLLQITKKQVIAKQTANWNTAVTTTEIIALQPAVDNIENNAFPWWTHKVGLGLFIENLVHNHCDVLISDAQTFIFVIM